MLSLTDRQEQALQFITAYIDNSGYPPSQREIASYLGISSPAVIKHLEALAKKGYIRRDSNSRAIALTAPLTDTASLPIVGTVRAGQLTHAVEEVLGYFAMTRAHQHGGTFFLKVRGDSMIEAAIQDGDLALVRPQPTAEDRDIVVAMLDGEATLKQYYQEQDHIRLQPRNSSMAPIIIRPETGDLQIIGKVVGLYRSLV